MKAFALAALLCAIVSAAPKAPKTPVGLKPLEEGEYARVLKVSGPVSVRALGHQGFRPADAGASLIGGDELKTGPGGVAHLELGDGAVLVVGGRSSFVLAGEAEDPLLQFKLGEWLLGAARKLGAGRSLRVVTPQAVAAVRGTLFWGKTDPRETQVAGIEREVEVTAAGKTVVLKPGQLVRVPTGQAPAQPVAYAVGADVVDRLRIDGSLAGLEGLFPKK
jgi:ferric-dicitrate binding protein FerR (iron transport regulator)